MTNDENFEIEAAEGKSQEPATDAEDLVAILKERLEMIVAEREALKADFLVTQADFANTRRRIEQKAKDDQKFASQRLITELIPVLDNFERTIRYIEGGVTAEQMLEGIQAVEKQLFGILQKQGVGRISPLGQEFDPERHEAIAIAKSDQPDDTVIEVLETGYTLSDRVVRPARVKVAG
ncbi:nucleotide exchange factor GrpE [bacterium]|nr:MAG: nucleotide exchange factor GrpE [bacterium]